MLEELKVRVWRENRRLQESGLVVLTWGNVSALDRERGLAVIKPSGLDYGAMGPEDMVVVDLEGRRVEGKWNPSSDTPTHLALYRAFPQLGGVAHTHSRWATVFAQAELPIPALGTTHADLFYGSVPCTRPLTAAEVAGDYEWNTGLVLAEALGNANPLEMPAALVRSHGPFTWGKTPEQAVDAAITLEECAQMAYATLQLNPRAALPQPVADRHYRRKHGPEAYYGQEGKR